MNKYEIIGIVGEGAYGVVYKAKCKETGDFGKLVLIIYFFKFVLKISSALVKYGTNMQR